MRRRDFLFPLIALLICSHAVADSQPYSKKLRVICKYSDIWPAVMGVRSTVCAQEPDEDTAQNLVSVYESSFAPGDLRKINVDYIAERYEEFEKAQAQLAKEEAEQAARKNRSMAAAAAAKMKRQQDLNYPPIEQLRAMNNADLCSTYRRAQSADAFAELNRRALFTSADIQAVKTNSVRIGMKQDALVCSLGSPTHRNRTVTASGEHVQWIYRATNIYTTNGVVSSWQD